MRLPIDPLLRLAGVRTPCELARVTGASKANLVRYARNGLTSVSADNLAVALGRVPHEVWGTEAWERCAVRKSPSAVARTPDDGAG